ncbi:unnamed protein product [Dovyalis caffra]|uniref:Uncharacterized protein n=1 Tax=Dovyalis caffra TaxID=77055 RepID=A0AAV1QS51_9ROSI|nr:unnamed protein product [Dovyalis caffra]
MRSGVVRRLKEVSQQLNHDVVASYSCLYPSAGPEKGRHVVLQPKAYTIVKKPHETEQVTQPNTDQKERSRSSKFRPFPFFLSPLELGLLASLFLMH